MSYNKDMNLDYQTIESEVMTEQEISKSKFLSYLSPITDEDEAKEYLKSIKKLHPKATHHCSAFIVGNIERSNDDGEPSSSAGMPMLQVLKGNTMNGVIAVVVRYYGGTQLGVGGLIRAYGSSVTQAIEAAVILKPQPVLTYTLRFPYPTINDVEVMLKDSADILDRRYDDWVAYDVNVLTDAVFESYNDITRGEGQLELINESIEYIRR